MVEKQLRPAQDFIGNALRRPQHQSREAGSCMGAERPVDHGGGTSASGIASQPPAAEEGSGGGSRLRLLAGQRSELADLIEDGPHRFQRQR